MTLKVELKPGERIVVGRSVLTNGSSRTSLLIDGSEPVLRERDILKEAEADTPAKRIAYVIQMMYLAGSADALLPAYTELARAALKAAPSMLDLVEPMTNCVLTGQLYKAFREARKLVAYEASIFEHAKRSAGLRPGGADDR
jgi:flagellar biosynthesis repressor protein FlbT